MLWGFHISLCLPDKIENWLKAFSVWRLRNRGQFLKSVVVWVTWDVTALHFKMNLRLATVKKMFLFSE